MTDESEVTEFTDDDDATLPPIVLPDSSPAPLPKVPVKNVYVLEQGDTPGRVSIKLYGRTHRAVELARLNMDCAWEPGDRITLP